MPAAEASRRPCQCRRRTRRASQPRKRSAPSVERLRPELGREPTTSGRPRGRPRADVPARIPSIVTGDEQGLGGPLPRMQSRRSGKTDGVPYPRGRLGASVVTTIPASQHLPMGCLHAPGTFDALCGDPEKFEDLADWRPAAESLLGHSDDVLHRLASHLTRRVPPARRDGQRSPPTIAAFPSEERCRFRTPVVAPSQWSNARWHEPTYDLTTWMVWLPCGGRAAVRGS